MKRSTVPTKTVASAGQAQAQLDALFSKFDKPNPVRLLTTGGTLEFVWDWAKDGLAMEKESVLPGYISGLQAHVPFNHTPICLKDSRELRQKDRRRIVEAVMDSPETNVLISHGCFTAPDTAEYLLDSLPAGHGKTVVIFGSKAPMKEFVLSDGPFNLGFATASSLALESGVYVAMDGRLFDARDVQVDAAKRFSERDDTATAQSRLERIFSQLNQPETVHLLRMGGTIESKWEPTKDTAVIDPSPLLQSYLERIRLQLQFAFTVVSLKDSREITYRDRKQLVAQVTESPHRAIIIPHGTYTMPDTAQFLNESLEAGHGKTIVLFGSMIPLNGFLPSDAPFNLGYAVATALVSKEGVYLAMNARLFHAEDVEKNRGKGRFEEA
ncbi:Uncharacterised protein [Candidatus Bilamarchaeum dharawalense]|uniref:L-asparaginase N-terminal domain-containing protein n=1 Tax=Candidatus Bilamarchaeum dharawalense TaxID=2885759 RepID=A0A5E4LS58_9ARCH|nr:Uncharacterised protein [Candidatus Bilamarchaeum dharawalense]